MAAAALVAVALLIGGGGATALGATPTCTLAPQLRDLTINQGLGSYTPLAWGKDTLLRLYMSQPSCAASGSLIQVTGATLTIAGGGTNRSISGTTPSLVSVYPALATYSTAPAVDSTGDVKFDVPGATLSPSGSEAGFTATFTATINYVQQPNSRTALAPGSVSFNVRPGTTTAITTAVAKKTNALRVLVVPMGDPTKLYNTQLTAAGQQEIQRGMLTLARIFPLRDGIATLTDTSASGLAAGLRYSISPTLLDVSALTGTTGVFCSNGTNFGTLRGLLAQFLQAWNSANPGTPADRVLGVGDQVVTNGSANGCDEGRAAINGNEAWVRLAYDTQGTPSNAGALMGMELAHTMGAVPAGRNDGAFHSQYSNSDYLVGDLNRAFNVATRSVLAGTSDDHTVMRLVSPWNNTNTVLEKADWGLLLCRLGGPLTSDCATAGTVGSAAAGPAFVMSGTTDGSAGIPTGTIGTATGTTVVESYFSASATTLPDSSSQYRLVQKQNGTVLTPYGNQGVPIAIADTHHDGTPSETHAEASLFSVALPFNTDATRIELWKGAPGATGSLLLYARNKTAAPTVTSMTSGDPILLSVKRSAKARNVGTPAVSKLLRATTHSRRTLNRTRPLQSLPSLRNPLSAAVALTTSFQVNDAGDGGDSNTADDLCKDASGNCTLRAAIQQANATAGADTITFSIGTGPVTIQPGATAVPAIAEALVIDGTTQGGPAYTGPPLVELNGSAAPGYGLASTAVVTIRGLVINRFPGSAISLFSGSGGSVVQGNYLGTNITGDTAAGNLGLGVQAFSSGNTIGGANASDRNVISANDTGIFLGGGNNTVTGNYIGTDATGTAALGNASAGIGLQASSSNTITNNVISATKPTNASGAGIDLYQSDTQSTNNVIQGNFIGTDKTGSNALGNSRRGINLNGASNNTIGGSGSGQANVISGNTGDGIDLPNGQQNTIQGNLIGVAANGTSALGNGGFGIQMNSSINAIGGSGAGEGNVIANNNGDGIVITGGTGNGVLGNRFYANASLGINLGADPVTANDAGDTDVGANNLQNFPVVSSATLGGGTLHLVGTLDTNAGLANPGFRIEAFLDSACDPSGNGEGEFLVGASNVSVDGSGHAAFTIDLPTSATGTVATATATAAGTGDTSEFSACASVTGGGGGGGGGPFVVNTTDDVDNGTCDATHCSLREAILAANGHANGDGPDAITFAIAGSGSQQIAVQASPLPAVTDRVTIDGDTERSTGTSIPADSKAIVLNGDGAGTADGLVLATGSGGSEVKGLAIRDFQCATAAPDPCASGYGLRLQSDGNTIDGNYIGLTANGVSPARNKAGGILVAANGNTIGGTTTAERNVIGGNAVPSSVRSQIQVTGNTNTIEGNYVGVAADGTTEQNDVTGITLQSSAHDNVIGGDKAIGNIILGRQGIEVSSDAGTGNIIAGNNIGLDAAGAVHASALPGIHVGGAGTVIGDNVSPPGFANPDKGNVIVGGSDAGIFMQGASGAKIAGNFVGTNRAGASGMGNGDGIRVSTGGNNTVGPGNTIAFNTAYGVEMGSATNRVVANSIHDNAHEGIHNNTAFVTIAQPTLTSAVKSDTNTTVNGTFSGTANNQFFIEFFKNTACDGSGAGEGETFIGFASPTTNGAGSASFSFSSSTLNAGDIITATATNATELSTSQFSVCKQVVTSTTPPGQERFDVGGSDDNAQSDLLDLYLDCGTGNGRFPIALAQSPQSSTSTTANWTYNYDASLACAGGQLKAIVNDGFLQSGFTATGTEPTESGQKSPFSAILSPGKGKTFLQYSGIPLKGIAVDPEDGALTPSWKLINSANVVIKTATGTTADLSPGANGWAPGPYTVELTATDTASKTTTSMVNITIAADADNDGIPASSETGCPGSSDTNPMDAYADKDGDGIPNVDDPQPCTAQTGPYTAVMSFQPNTFPIPSSGNTVTVTVRVPYRSLSQVLATTVAITKVNGDPVTFRSVSWKVTDNVGTAFFDRQALASYFASNQIHNRNVVFTISGRSAAPPWSFEGVATTFVAG